MWHVRCKEKESLKLGDEAEHLSCSLFKQTLIENILMYLNHICLTHIFLHIVFIFCLS